MKIPSTSLFPVFALAATTACASFGGQAKKFESCMAELPGVRETDRTLTADSFEASYGFRPGEVRASVGAAALQRDGRKISTFGAAYIDPNNPATQTIQRQVGRCEHHLDP